MSKKTINPCANDGPGTKRLAKPLPLPQVFQTVSKEGDVEVPRNDVAKTWFLIVGRKKDEKKVAIAMFLNSEDEFEDRPSLNTNNPFYIF